MTLTFAVDLLVGCALAAWATFAALYHVKAAWFATAAGRNIMGVSVAIVAFLALVFVARVWPDFDRQALQVVVYAWLAYLGVQRLGQMLRMQRRTRAARAASVADVQRHDVE